VAHELEKRDGKWTMAYNGDVPWHGLGKNVSGLQLTPQQMLKEAGCDWTVRKVQASVTIDQLLTRTPTSEDYEKAKKAKKKAPEPKQLWVPNNIVMLDSCALVRDIDGKVLDTVSPDWEPVQNQEAMEFFNEFVMAGDMEMETVGSLKGGQIVWGLAKVKESFELFKGDKVQSYLLFSNFHKYGHSTAVHFTPVRVVCNNTLTLSLSTDVDKIVRYTHRRKFNPDEAKVLLGVAHDKLAKYKEMAAFLGGKKAKPTDVVEYFKQILPGTKDKIREMSRNAETAYNMLDCQPGHQYAEGSWWQPFNAVTFFLDHEISRTADQRMKQAWYGTHRTIKTKALELAVEFAGK